MWVDVLCMEGNMKKKRFAGPLILSIILVLAALLPGCGQKTDDYDIMEEMEEPELTVEYLSGEYAQQLLRDGGEERLGTISIDQDENGKYSLTVNSMVIVESSITDEGYYIADKNISETFPLDQEARVTYIKKKSEGPQVTELDEFISLVQEDAQAASGSEEEKLYDVYIIGGSALMLLARELPDV